jgi:tripartite-type tricarboxylate transporter receptor subunit TctC
MRWVMVGVMALVASTLVGTAKADDYPNRPIHVVIGFAAGSDRAVFDRLAAAAHLEPQ